jgi:3-hydroxyisobutyrate dehydrogenase
MYTRYKTPVLTNLTFDQVTFTPKLLLKDMDLGLAAAKAQGVPMPAAAATRESIARMVGRGHDHIDFAVLLKEVAADSGLELKSENKQIDDGLAS